VTQLSVGLDIIGGISATGDEKEIKEANDRYTLLLVSIVGLVLTAGMDTVLHMKIQVQQPHFTCLVLSCCDST
jgi:hypothetical protein